jgi:16S rRNA (adenine1518-N6/adenine1519-N6)-dimethyltransferase
VESAVERLEPLAQRQPLDMASLDDLLRRAFSARRKQLRNALPLAMEGYAELNIDPQSRPENLSPADYLRIAEYLAANPG